MNPDNDRVEVYKDPVGEWRWRRIDTGNGQNVANSGEGYEHREYAAESAAELNPGAPVVFVDE